MTSIETVLLVPAVKLVPAVEEFRLRYAPSARAGIPPHITVSFPFVDPSRVTEADVLGDLDRLLSDSAAFDYVLAEVREFEQGVLYLAPEPAERFIEMTDAASAHFGIKPFGGAYPTVIPHLTVTESAGAGERKRIGSLLGRELPLAARASEVWVMVGSNQSTWTTVHKVQLA